MAKFSLTLINNRGATVLTQYDALTNETAGLTFDENLQLSVDGSTLSFSMLKYLYEGSQKVTNTAALSIIYGSIIRCEYNTKRYDFVVTDIKYNFMSENLRLDFTATDYFQFENSQIGVGYTITTDTTDPEYLGAMPIDEWVYKIIRDNNIRWTYTPINTANQDVINILNNADERMALYNLDQDETEYWEEVEESKTLNTWVSFECSNASAFAALKQLATDNELIIEVNYSNHSFCFKPQKSFIFNGYYFNPSNNLQAFSVQGNADNLITVLNITGGKDLNNQEITLVPSIPEPIIRFINSNEWLQSIYYPNLYDDYAADYPQFVREITYTPWFENKLIDVSYFTNNNLLLPTEVFEIQDILYNQLRRINARLIVAQTAYLQKYEQDYMDVNQRRIDAETLGARLYGDIEVLTKPIDYTKPPIFIVKADNGDNELGPQNWVYVAPGSRLHAKTDDYDDVVNYTTIIQEFQNYLGTTDNIESTSQYVTPKQLSYYIRTPKTALSPEQREDLITSTGTTINTDRQSTVIFCDLGPNGYFYLGYPTQPSTTFTLRISGSGGQKDYICEVQSDGEVDVISGSDLTFQGNKVIYTNFPSRVSSIRYTLTYMQVHVIDELPGTNRDVHGTLSINNGDINFSLTTGSGDIYPYTNMKLHTGDDLIPITANDNQSISNPRYIKLEYIGQPLGYPQHIYLKSVPDQIELYNESSTNTSEHLKIIADDMGQYYFTTLYDSQFVGTPQEPIAGLDAHLNSLSNLREQMLQHLMDNWGFFYKLWHQTFRIQVNQYTYELTTLGNLYATYRKIGIITTPQYKDSIEIGDRFSDACNTLIIDKDIKWLKQLLKTETLLRSNIVRTIQNLYTKLTEYWQQCYNAALSVGIYWPQTWDCLDTLEQSSSIFPFYLTSLPLINRFSTAYDGERWSYNMPELNLYGAPMQETYSRQTVNDNLYYSHRNINIELSAGTMTTDYMIDIHLQFQWSSSVSGQSVANLKTFDYTGKFVNTSISISNVTVTITLQYTDLRHYNLKIDCGDTNPSSIINVAGTAQVYVYTNPYIESVYAHSYKFLDDNNIYRPVYTPQVDNTQFIYQPIDIDSAQSDIEPYHIILNKHNVLDNLNLYYADLRYKEEHYTHYSIDNCKLPSQWLAAAVPFTETADVQPTGASNDIGNPNLALITYLAKASQYNNAEYYEYLHQHDELWQHMYQQFPGVFRESNFTNTTAITSQELYESARRELDKVSQPAYQYSLTGMDIYMHDSDYEPTRIKLGDQIRIDYQELNELNDSLNAALREPLYITGITHTLRNDGDYQFTVTTRSATDTMLQRFANILMFK